MGDRSHVEAFNRNFRKKQRAQLRLLHEDSQSPPPDISLQIVEGYELYPTAPTRIKQSQLPAPLEPKERVTCFRKVLHQQTKRPKLPPIIMAPKPPEEKPKAKDGGTLMLRMVQGLKPHSKQHTSAAALGLTMQRLQQDPDKYSNFVSTVEQQIKASKDPHAQSEVGIRRNILSARHYFPTEYRQMLTARHHLRQMHTEEVQARGSGFKTARAAAVEAKVYVNELRRDKIYDRIAQRQAIYVQRKACWLVALHSRTSFLVRVICEARAERWTQMKRTNSSIKIQRNTRRWLAYKKHQQRHEAQLTILRTYKMFVIRRILKNRRQAADCLLAWLRSHTQKSMPYLLAIRELIATVTYLQGYWRNIRDMWITRRELHQEQWLGAEANVLVTAASQFRSNGMQIPSIIPTHIRAKVLDQFIREAKGYHSHHVRKYHQNSQLFLRRHRRTIEQKMAMALLGGHISIKQSHQEFMRLHMPDVWAKRPKRPWYCFCLSGDQVEDLVLEGARLTLEEELGPSTMLRASQSGQVGRWETGDAAAGRKRKAPKVPFK